MSAAENLYETDVTHEVIHIYELDPEPPPVLPPPKPNIPVTDGSTDPPKPKSATVQATQSVTIVATTSVLRSTATTITPTTIVATVSSTVSSTAQATITSKQQISKQSPD
ncbi:unnamed protein product [Didymodactylos carnosus]|uniref:Uncharacterized protein n=1 Tax=Didymodactylos carnosus TaxID=1234261 RepID=A0A8S2EZR8_9BILA|nr:unnamed protein product [Didymodactylos carnosus]CAF4165001.1 unnamed protein product [Didymodactylos carnosus]